jgi:hypothetical protein
VSDDSIGFVSCLTAGQGRGEVDVEGLVMNAKNAALVIGLIAVLAVGTLARTQPEDPTLPPGVSEEEWIPISDSLGIAVTGMRIGPSGQTLASGMVMARFEGEWIIFENVAPPSLPRVQPLK